MNILFYKVNIDKVIVSDWRLLAIEYLKPDITFWAGRYQNQHNTKDDISQELTAHLYKKLPLFKPSDKATLRTWAWTVIRFKIIDLWRVSCKEQRTQRRKEK